MASVLQYASSAVLAAKSRYYVSTAACFLWWIATVLLAVHRFAVAASLRIRTALPLEQP